MKINRVVVSPHELRIACTAQVQLGNRFVTMAASDEKPLGVDRFVLRYVFAQQDRMGLTVIESVVSGQNPEYPSVSAQIPAASWAEREACDLFGLRPMGHPDLRPLVLHEHWPDGVHPLLKEVPLNLAVERDTSKAWAYPKVEGEGVFEVPVGPIHAGVIEPGHFRFHVMGDSVLHLEAKLFYTHRGIEKRSEGMSLAKGLFLAERICGVCSVSHAMSYAQAVESIAGVHIPKRAQYLRVLFAEMERLYNHVGDIGNICAGIGYAYGSNHGARLKERLMQMNDAIAGHRFLRGTIALGGAAVDVTPSALAAMTDALREVRDELDEIVEQILSHDVVINRFAKTGTLTEQVARDFSAVGPAARASGCDVDVRRDLPYAAYSQLSFDVPVLREGDVLARFKQRYLETLQSLRLVEQVAEEIPDGDTVIPIGGVPAHGFGIGVTESARGENAHFLMTGKNDTIFRYRVRSASYANWPVVPYCVPGNIVPDFPLINKSFELCYACCDR